MTNGEKIKELFPHFDVEDKTEYFGRLRNLDDHFIKADIDFWNAEYKDPTTKNDLGVDCISRADARSLVVKIGTKDILGMSGKAFQDLYKGIDNLPPVTPQEPILDKIRAEIEQLRLHKAQFLTNDNKVCIDSQEVLNVIDKYKAESEG